VELFSHQMKELRFSDLLDTFASVARIDGRYFLCDQTNQKMIGNLLEGVKELTVKVARARIGTTARRQRAGVADGSACAWGRALA
jgi:hypothetical protein